MSTDSQPIKTAKVIFTLGIITLFPGIYLGLSKDIWGWWYIPLTLLIISLAITMRSPGNYKKPAKTALILISSILVLMAIGAIAFVIWFSDFEF